MNALNYKISTALTVIFAVCLLALVLEIIYVIWRRRRFRELSSGGDVEVGDESLYSASPSKDLLYFLCCKSQTTRIEPAQATAVAPSAPPLPAAVADTELDEMLKWQGMYGPSRFLATIKEEEREDLESEALSSAENEAEKKKKKKKRKKSIVLLEAVAVESVAVVDVDVDETTPFSTPCASPPFYTPTGSPPRDGNSSSATANEDGVVLQHDEKRSPSDDKTAPFTSDEVHPP